MIDAKSFASSYNAFWSEAAPTCEHFVRRLNLESVERFEPPLPSSGGSRAALIAEFAFSLFVERTVENRTGTKRSNAEITEAAWVWTEKRLAPYASQGLDITQKCTKHELDEVLIISDRLVKFFRARPRQLILKPIFSGCGFVDNSEGDVIAGDTIYEIKTVQRTFRSTDIKQAVVYAALNYGSKQYIINNIGIVNPRNGLFCLINLERLCIEIAGVSAENFFGIVTQELSSGELSR
ncbi:MAG: hypothetical protein ABSF49_15885 [Roseiarcus sp.]|uniref:hypothetical protein n=1 Tax=Roseiarcus sp. TaxID=1969460 RepID=UPI003C199FAF